MKSINKIQQIFIDELNDLFDHNELKQVIQICLNHVCGLTIFDILVNREDIIEEIKWRELLEIITELKSDKPLAYILGKWHFFDLDFKVNEHTLIPRPETEELVQLILNSHNGKKSVLDIGTGSGCIPIALKKNSSFRISACDISAQALEIAKENAQMNNVEIDFFELDILNNFNKKLVGDFDIIVSNPPYITVKEKSLMNKNVVEYEPHIALFVNDEEPLLFYDKIADFAKINLSDLGVIYFEINENYGQHVVDLLKAKGFKQVKLIKDINDKDRIVSASIN